MIRIIEISVSEIDLIKPLWEKLREYQASKSIDFKDELQNNTWEKRKKGLTDGNRRLRILVAEDIEYIGYCISSIANGSRGEIDSIFIDSNYRQSGIGSEFMSSTLKWFEENGITDIYISVVVGNEDVLGFYGKFGFKPRTVYLKRA